MSKPVTTWEDVLELGPVEISRRLGCPVTTASSWINRSGPADWSKAHYLRAWTDPQPAVAVSLSASRRVPKSKPKS